MSTLSASGLDSRITQTLRSQIFDGIRWEANEFVTTHLSVEGGQHKIDRSTASFVNRASHGTDRSKIWPDYFHRRQRFMNQGFIPRWIYHSSY